MESVTDNIDSNTINVNVASGKYVIEDFINLDYNRYLILSRFPMFLLRPVFNKDRIKIIIDYKNARKKAVMRVHNCLKPLPFERESVNHILCSHFIEHISKNEALKILRNFHRVLKYGGTLHIIVPDLEWRAHLYLNNKTDSSSADLFLKSLSLVKENEPGFFVRILELFGTYGSKHKWMYDNRSLSILITNAGFRIQNENNSPSSQYRLNDKGQVNILAVK